MVNAQSLPMEVIELQQRVTAHLFNYRCFVLHYLTWVGMCASAYSLFRYKQRIEPRQHFVDVVRQV